MNGVSYKLVVEYDGSDFNGWQSQPNGRTVQDELERALQSLFQEPIRVTAAGRTDAGVHALGQVVNFRAKTVRTGDEVFLGLNTLLPEDVCVKEVEFVSHDFNSRFHARSRTYRYNIYRGNSALWRRYAWCLRETICVHDMQRCADLILGQHDFQSFCSSSAETKHFLCSVQSAKWQFEAPNVLVFTITANRFLHNMVRILVGTMVEIGRGRFSVDDFKRMLQVKDRRAAGVTAPACGLFLVKVTY